MPKVYEAPEGSASDKDFKAAARILSGEDRGFVIGGDWRLEARCKNMNDEIFFPISDSDSEQALRVCGECTVKIACLSYALLNKEKEGVLGRRHRGTSKK